MVAHKKAGAASAQAPDKELTAGVRLPVLSEQNFRYCAFARVPEAQLMYPDVQLFLRVLARGFNVTYAELRGMFHERGVHFHLPGHIGL